MAIVEAASCGLLVVSTRVGGIPEVLPSNLITLTDASVDALYDGIVNAIAIILKQRQTAINTNGPDNKVQTLPTKESLISSDTNDTILCPYERNERVRELYNWNNVTMRTERVYRRVMNEMDPTFGDKLNAYRNACAPFILVVSFSYLLLRFLDWLEPRRFIDLAVSVRSGSKHKSSFRKKTNWTKKHRKFE